MSVVILDYGSQYTRLIARRIRELNAFSIILPGAASIERIRSEAPTAIVLSERIPRSASWSVYSRFSISKPPRRFLPEFRLGPRKYSLFVI